MYSRVIVAAAVVAVAAAAPGAMKPTACIDVPVVEVKNVTEYTTSNVCAPLPAGVCGSGVMIANVSYELPCAFGCPTKTTVWCEGNKIVDETKKQCASKYWFCCGTECKGVPEARFCEVDGKNYTVGVSYDLGNSTTLWCVDEETAVTCTGAECGSTLELTPPRVETCPVRPVPPKPEPEPECRCDADCKCPFGVACECKMGKCVPAERPIPERPIPDDHAMCRSDRDCPPVDGLVLECKNKKCVPAEGPFPDEGFSLCACDADCPVVDGVAFECKNNKCVAAEEKPECRKNADCECVDGVALECKKGKCVPAEISVSQE